MLEFLNIGHMITFATSFESRDFIELYYDVITFISKRPGTANFAEIIKITTTLIKTTL